MYEKLVRSARRSLNTVTRENPYGRFVTVTEDWMLSVTCENWRTCTYSCEVWNGNTGEEHSMLFVGYENDRELSEAMGLFAVRFIG